MLCLSGERIGEGERKMPTQCYYSDTEGPFKSEQQRGRGEVVVVVGVFGEVTKGKKEKRIHPFHLPFVSCLFLCVPSSAVLEKSTIFN